jgi:hypothetical protein
MSPRDRRVIDRLVQQASVDQMVPKEDSALTKSALG